MNVLLLILSLIFGFAVGSYFTRRGAARQLKALRDEAVHERDDRMRHEQANEGGTDLLTVSQENLPATIRQASAEAVAALEKTRAETVHAHDDGASKLPASSRGYRRLLRVIGHILGINKPTAQIVPTLRFVENGAETRSAIAAAADALMQSRRANPRVRVVVEGDRLSTQTIATLIAALRKLREVGGAIELTAENEAARGIIFLHGLERVFAFPLLPGESSPVEQHSRTGIYRIFRHAAAAIGAIRVPSPASRHVRTARPLRCRQRGAVQAQTAVLSRS